MENFISASDAIVDALKPYPEGLHFVDISNITGLARTTIDYAINRSSRKNWFKIIEPGIYGLSEVGSEHCKGAK